MTARADFLADAPVIRAKFLGGRLIGTNEIERAILATVPAVIAAIALVLFGLARWIAANVDAGAAHAQLTLTQHDARYALEERDATIARTTRVQTVSLHLDQLHGSIITTLVPLVNIANALPSTVRLVTVAARPQTIAITKAEALDYDAILNARKKLATSFPLTIATTDAPSIDTATVGDAQNTAHGTWSWSANVTIPTPAPPRAAETPRVHLNAPPTIQRSFSGSALPKGAMTPNLRDVHQAQPISQMRPGLK